MSTSKLRFRVRAPNGSQQVLDGFSSASTIKALQIGIINKFNFAEKNPACIQIKYIYPPPQIISTDNTKTLKSLNITSGNLIINFVEAPKISKKPEQKNNDINQHFMIKKEIESDNSCLFNAVSYVCEEGVMNKTNELRQIIASIVMSDPKEYNQGILGKSNENYIKYILNDQTWGGSIELSILSKYYEIQINAIDITTLRCNKFGENCNYKECVYVIYDGIHYDALVLDLGNNNKFKYKFNTNNDEIFALALSVAADLNQKKQYTDVYNFTLRCVSCQAKLKGQKDAQKHAELTGHANFEEYHNY